jgi:drug/metabolite transporter (DMT)-like permease
MEKIIKSFKQNYKGILLMAAASLCTAFGQMFWKLSLGEISLNLIVGFALYGIGAVLMIVAFKFGAFSVIHPMLCLSYVFVIFIGVFIIGESINAFTILAIILIMIGVVFIGGGDD